MRSAYGRPAGGRWSHRPPAAGLFRRSGFALRGCFWRSRRGTPPACAAAAQSALALPRHVTGSAVATAVGLPQRMPFLHGFQGVGVGEADGGYQKATVA